jgi:uncharacterized protein YjbI with pentapeptide repeats
MFDQVNQQALIIFDGLDELAMQGQVGAKIAQDFVREIQRKVERFNQRETYLQVLISGRELVIQANETDFRKDGQILHVLPYFIPIQNRNRYIDSNKLLDQDQRHLWWQNYGAASGSGFEGLPPELDQGNLIEITSQPLLNYLVALSLKRGKLQFAEGTNLNTVYADLIKAIYERGWAEHQHTAIQGIKEEEFIRILEEIALAAWHGNGRTTTVSEIERHCETSNLKHLLNRFQLSYQSDSKANITRLMTAFYFRQSGHDHSGNRTFEFTHKSFGEYLTARRIVQEVRYIHAKLTDRYCDSYDNWDERSALHRWAIVCGASAISNYLYLFVLDEISLRHKQGPSHVAAWQQTLCGLIGFTLRHGFPIERINPRLDYYEEKKYARNSEEALLAVLSCCALATKDISNIQWPAPDSFGNWLMSLQRQRTGGRNALALSCLDFLNLEGCTLYVADLYSASLHRSNLSRARLSYAFLMRASFVDANMTLAQLAWANLQEADLRLAILKRAILAWANLRQAKLKGSNLEGANLEGANLEGANLEGANLEGANLVDANLEGANLEGANLVGANLEGTNLEGANLEGARLKSTNPLDVS